MVQGVFSKFDLCYRTEINVHSRSDFLSCFLFLIMAAEVLFKIDFYHQIESTVM